MCMQDEKYVSSKLYANQLVNISKCVIHYIKVVPANNP